MERWFYTLREISFDKFLFAGLRRSVVFPTLTSPVQNRLSFAYEKEVWKGEKPCNTEHQTNLQAPKAPLGI